MTFAKFIRTYYVRRIPLHCTNKLGCAAPPLPKPRTRAPDSPGETVNSFAMHLRQSMLATVMEHPAPPPPKPRTRAVNSFAKNRLMSLAALPTSCIVKTLEQNGLFKNLLWVKKIIITYVWYFILHGQAFIQPYRIFLWWGNVDACTGCMYVLVHLLGFYRNS